MKLKVLKNGNIEMTLNCKGTIYKEVFNNLDGYRNFIKNFKIN